MSSPPTPTPATPRTSRLARLARAFDPRTPLFSKEVAVSGRRISTYITRAVYALIMLGLASIAYSIATDGLQRQSTGFEWIQHVQALAPGVTMTILWFQFVVLALLACVLTAPSFCDERRHGTLGALFTTPLTAFQMCIGKLAGQMVQILILVAIAAPLLLALRVFGGLEADVILLGLGLVVTTALLGASASMFQSVFAKRPVSAASGAVLILMLAYGLPPLVLWGLISRNIITPRFEYFAIFSPPAAMGVLTAHASGQPVGNLFHIATVLAGAMAYNAGLATLFLFGTTVLVRRAMIRDAGERRAEPKKAKRTSRRSAVPTPAPEVAPPAATPTPAEPDAESLPGGVKRRKRRIQVAHAEGPVDLGDHPVRWRELRQPMVNAGWWPRIIVTFLVVGALVWIHYLAHKDDSHGKVYMVTCIIGAVLTAFLASVAASGAISQERESRTLETLLCTPLTAWDILVGKFWGAFKRQLLIPAFVLAHLLVGVLFKVTVHPAALLHTTLTLLPPIAFLCATGTFFSVVLRKGTAAAIANFLFAAALWMGLPLGWAIVSDASGLRGRTRQFTEDVMVGILSINPVPNMGVIVHATVRDESWGRQFDYDFLNMAHMSFGGFVAMQLAVAAAFIVGAFFVLRLASRVLAAKTGRHVPFLPNATPAVT